MYVSDIGKAVTVVWHHSYPYCLGTDRCRDKAPAEQQQRERDPQLRRHGRECYGWLYWLRNPAGGLESSSVPELGCRQAIGDVG